MLAAFIDTNTILHYPPLEQIDWVKVCDAEELTIILCRTVVKELDEKKYHASLGNRARKRIKELLDSSDKEIRPKVWIKVFDKSPAGIDQEDNDEKIVQTAILYRNTLGGDIAVISEDMGMRLRCRAHGVRDIQPPEEQQLEDPLSEEQKKFREQQQELIALKNKLPDLKIVGTYATIFGNGTELKRPTFPPVEELLAGVKKQIRTEYNYSEDDKSVSAYLRSVELWYRCQHQLIDESARTLRLNLTLHNKQGTAPAKTIKYRLSFPEHLQAVQMEYWQHGERMFNASPPKNLPGIPVILPQMAKSFPNDLTNHKNLGPYGSTVSGRQLEFKLNILEHDGKASLASIYVTFADWNSVKPFPLPVYIHTMDPPNLKEFDLLIPASVAK